MATFEIPSAEEFASWSDDYMPRAVVRLLCNLGHPITEWWRTATATHPWGGHTAPVGTPEERPLVKSEGVGFPHSPKNPERPEETYWRLRLWCRAPDCDYERVLTPAGLEPLWMLDALVAGEIPQDSPQRLKHPSGAEALQISADNLFGYRRV